MEYLLEQKPAKYLRTGKMEVNMKLAKWYVKGLWYIYIHCMLYSMYKGLFQFLQPKIVCRRETADRIQKGYLGFLHHTYLYFRQTLF